jgi:hypothetical protein
MIAQWPMLCAAAVCGLAGAAGSPFGILPTPQLWDRWSSHASYQAAASAIVAVTEPDALIVAQAQPTLSVYVPRDRLPIGNVAFTEVLSQVGSDRPCYLVVDFFWLYSQSGTDALDAVKTALAAGKIRAVASVDNDLSISTLSDFLTPTQIAEKIARDPEAPRAPTNIPPPLEANQHDVITVYAVERD